MAAPQLNLNAIRNGTRLARLTVGELPKQLNSVKIEGRKYRVALERATTEAHGEVDVMSAHHIDTATAGMIHCGICRWLLRERIGTMSTADILACSGQMLRAKEGRDRAVKLLKLDRDARDTIDALYSTPTAPADTADTPPSTPIRDVSGSNGKDTPPIPKRPHTGHPRKQKGNKK